jgi:hypothetical protein
MQCLKYLFWPIALATMLAGCGDFSNRTYRYNEEIPLAPFVIKLTQVKYGAVDGNMIITVSLDVTNKSPDRNNLSRNRFTLRVGQSGEVARDKTFLEVFGVDTISFVPGENATVNVPFVVSDDALNQRLALIVDRQTKNGRERLTLIEVKGGSRPKNLPAAGETRVTRSTRWE